MAFVDRKKQAHLWRDGALAPQHMTPEQIVIQALADHAAGVAVDFASKLIAKAFNKYKLAPPSPTVAPASPPKAKKKAKAPKAAA